MFCPYCGKEPPTDAVFCNHCGRNLEKESLITGSDVAWRAESEVFTPSSPYEEQTVSFQEPLSSAKSQGEGSFIADARTAKLVGSPLPLYEEQTMSFQVQSLPQNRLQQLMVRTFDSALAGNALFGVLLGSIIAVVGGVLISWLLVTIAHLMAAQLVQTPYRGDNIDYILGMLPIHMSLKDSLQLFLIMHGIAEHLSGANGDNFYVSPLHGLLVLPALLLTLGGYIAACTDLQNHVQRSLVRGAAIAVPYTFFLFIITTQVNGDVPPSSTTGSISALNIDTTTLLVFGLLWGVLFGLLGASLKIAHGQWRHMLRQYLQVGSHVQLKGMIVGGLSSAGLGISLALLWLYSFFPYTPYNFFWRGDFCNGGPWQILVLWDTAQGPLYAVNLFFFSLGAPIATHIKGQDEIVSCFYATASQPLLTWSNGSLHLPVLMYTLLLIPAISLFLGGRVSASLARARLRGVGSRLVQGAAIALPFTAFMVLCTLISTITYTQSAASSTSVASPSAQAWVGVSATDLLLWAILWSSVLGALGGAYQGSAMQIRMSKILTALTRPLTILSWPIYVLLDNLSGIPRSTARSHTRSLLYGALSVTLLLAIIAAATGVALIAWNQTLSFNTNQNIKDVLSCILIVLPGLLLVCSCAAALSHDPLG